MSTHANQIMQYLLECFEHQKTPPGGWFLEAQLRQLSWNPNFTSLKRLDQWFDALRQTPHQLVYDPKRKDQRNTLLLLSAYVAQVLSHTTGNPYAWHHYQDFLASHPHAQSQIAKTFGNSMLLRLGEQWLSPIEMVYKQFFAQKPVLPLSLQIENVILAQQLQLSTDTTAWMHVFQKMVNQEAIIPGGLDYAQIIHQNRPHWDYSITSLQQLDSILYQIHLDGDFQNSPQYLSSSQVNFIFWVCAYLGSTIARLAQCPLYWHNQELINQPLHQPPSSQIQHLRVAQLGSEWYFFINFIMDYLLGKTNQDIPTYAHHVIKALPSPMLSRLNLHQRLSKQTDVLSKKTMLATGFTAAHLLAQLPHTQKKSLDSMLFDGKRIQYKHFNDQTVELYWQRNVLKQPLLSLAYAHTVHLPTQMLPSIEVKTKICLIAHEPMTVSVAFPFLPSGHYRGLTFFEPYLINAPKGLRQQFIHAAPYLLVGIQQYENQNQPFWQRYHQPSGLF